jgi:hypothetical protein
VRTLLTRNEGQIKSFAGQHAKGSIWKIQCGRYLLSNQREYMENTMRKIPPKQSTRGGGLLNALLLGLLSIFEVTFDILSLVSALLGGFVLDTNSASRTNTTTIDTLEDASQVAPQVGVGNRPEKRPVGVMVIALLLGILAIFEIVFGTFALVTSLFGSFILPFHSAAVGSALGVLYLLVGLVKLFFAWGLWELKRWAYWATVFIAAMSMLSSILAVTQPTPTTWVLLFDLLIPVVILIYFVVDSKVRAAFRN